MTEARDQWEQNRLLKIVNLIKDINCATAEKMEITYSQIVELDYADRTLAKALGFEQPECENGHINIYADYVVQKKVDKKSKK